MSNEALVVDETEAGDGAQALNRFVAIPRFIHALPSGERAKLRRLKFRGVPPGAFWRMVERYQIHPKEEGFWRLLMPLLARLKHTADGSLGAQVARGGVKAFRIERWLSMDRKAAIRQAHQVLYPLRSSGANWYRLGPLLRYWREEDKVRFARDYYREVQIQEARNNNTTRSNEA